MRKPRKLQKNASYHITAKINRGEFIFKQDEIKLMFLDIIKEAKKKYKFLVKNFCIMDNHVHFIIEPLDNFSLSKIMQWILSVFAIRYNKIHKISGHIWYDRFKSKIIKNFKQFQDTFDYINENPVKANIVKNSFDYKFCGFYFILNGIFDISDKETLIGTEVYKILEPFQIT
jgi:putative transposase